ncbi:MAG TPA: DUF2207 domain-containing protein, partial [Candidatus Pacearchaeota archaeon]|nr:DUF2207 domain-containing protein [Candidatus Pacearchaeota archaeon]
FGAGFISGIIILVYSEFMDKKTEKGLSDFYKYKNLKSWMEKYPLKEERMFNEFLPYSIVFGIHKKWANKFENSVQDENKQISWYSGYSGSFASSFSSFSISATSFGTNSGSGGGFGGSSGGGGGGGGSGGGGGGAG